LLVQIDQHYFSRPTIGGNEQFHELRAFSIKYPFTTVSRINHDVEQLTRLQSIPDAPQKIINKALVAYKKVQNELATRTATGEGSEVTLSASQWKLLRPYYNRILYLPPQKDYRLPSDQYATRDFKPEESIQLGESFQTSGFVVIDDVMTAAARESLLRYGDLGTIWFDTKPSAIGAPIDTGLIPPVLAQFIDQLRDSLPDLFCQYPLIQGWAIKIDPSLMDEQVKIRVDESKLSVSIWVASDDSDIEVTSADLLVRSIPFDHYPFVLTSHQPSSSIPGLNLTTVPYLANRAVVSKSSFYVTPINVNFKPGQRQQRLFMLTLLFGIKDEECIKPAKALFRTSSAAKDDGGGDRPKISFTASS